MTRSSNRTLQRRRARLVKATREAASVADAHLARFLLQTSLDACRDAGLPVDDTRQLQLLLALAVRQYNHHVGALIPELPEAPAILDQLPHPTIRKAMLAINSQLEPQVHKHPWSIRQVELTVDEEGTPSLALASDVREGMQTLAAQAHKDPEALWLATGARPADMLDMLRSQTLP